MKLWWMVALNLIAVTAAARVIAADGTQPIKDPDGKPIGLVLICSSCETSDAPAKQCASGVQQGWLNGKPCGKCLLTENAGQGVHYAYDLHVTGKLVDAAGAPQKQRFVKMFLSNGWTIRSRTADDGVFRLMLGATETRKSKTPLVVDLGTRTDAKQGTDDYAFYVLPESYKSCPPEAAKPATKKQAPPSGHKPKSKKL